MVNFFLFCMWVSSLVQELKIGLCRKDTEDKSITSSARVSLFCKGSTFISYISKSWYISFFSLWLTCFFSLFSFIYLFTYLFVYLFIYIFIYLFIYFSQTEHQTKKQVLEIFSRRLAVFFEVQVWKVWIGLEYSNF